MKQFDFARRWKKELAPHLDDPNARWSLQLGLTFDRDYREGDAPWMIGRLGSGPVPKEGALSWYQPEGRAHRIAPFCWALARTAYPELEWGFVSGDRHTVIVGHRGDPDHPVWVMDILLFRDQTAEESLARAKGPGSKFHASIRPYMATFTSDPDATMACPECAALKMPYED
jgi:hypothetical protein